MKKLYVPLLVQFSAFMLMSKGTFLARFLFVPPNTLPAMLLYYLVFLYVLYRLMRWADGYQTPNFRRTVQLALGGALAAYILQLANFATYMTIRDLPVRFGFFEDEFYRAVVYFFPILLIGEFLRNYLKKSILKTALFSGLSLLLMVGLYRYAYGFEPATTYPSIAKTSPDKPNVIVILADDLGFGDISLNNKNLLYQTPNIDQLAQEGVNFRSGYCTSPICSPSRAGLMTGQHQQRWGFEHLTDAIAHHLMSRKADFANAGHQMGGDYWWNYEVRERGLDPRSTTLAEFLKEDGYATAAIGKWHLGILPRFQPSQHGFDYHLGTYNAGMYYGNRKDTALVESYHPDNFVDLLEWQIMNYVLFENGKPIKKQMGEEYTTDVFTNKAVNFIDKNKENRFFLYLPYTAVHSPLQAPKRIYDKLSHIKDHHQRVYAAMVLSVDESVGKIMQKLKESGLDENTLVVFSSDNGAPLYYPAGTNTPYYGGKMSNFEGGLRVPFLMRWKTKISPQTYSNPVSLMDVFATVADAVGKGIPKNTAQDGVSLLPFIKSKQSSRPHETLFWRVNYAKTARKGDWKLNINEKEGFTYLHDLSTDSLETTNLASKHPEKVAELKKLYADWEKNMTPRYWQHSADVKIEDGKGKRFYFPW